VTLFKHDFVMFRLSELWQYKVWIHIESGNITWDGVTCLFLQFICWDQ